MNKILAAVCILACVSAPLLAQGSAVATPEEEITKFNLTLRELGPKLRSGEDMNVLGRLDLLKSLEIEYSGNEAALEVIRTEISQLTLPRAGDYARAHRYADLVDGRLYDQAPPAPLLDGYSPVDAIEAIAKAAVSRQVVMINEAHHVPQHRAFTIQLLAALREKGFTYFAAETLHPDADLAKRGYPTRATGAYIEEPLYGDIVRTALRLGYKVIPYEHEEYVLGESMEVRERDQTRNLFERILQKDPKAKVLIHAGYGHISESDGPRRTMASYFKEKTGIDPLTINQYWTTEHGAPEFEEPLYRQVTERGLIKRPVVFRNAAGDFWSRSRTFDVTLFHPRSEYKHGRPTWLRMGGLRMPLLLKDGICGPAPRCLVQARPAKEGADAIPIDQILVEKGKEAPALMVPAGEIVIRVEDARGKVVSEKSATVPVPRPN
jgi:hypothetical protein